MTIRLVRAALVKLHQEKAATIRKVREAWPLTPLDEEEFPLALFRRGEAEWYRGDGAVNQARTWETWVFLVVKDTKTLGYAENLAIDITQELGELYTDPANEFLQLASECEYAQLVQHRARQGEAGIADTPVITLEYHAKDYYGLVFDLPIIEKRQ
jgi:hypothetical protein